MYFRNQPRSQLGHRAHVEAGIELRLVPSLWPLHGLAVSDRWGYSIVRMRNAAPPD